MDVFHIDTSISSTMVDAELCDDITEVKFETHSEVFDLNFFDTPDDSMTQAAFSNPNSVESSTSPTPEPLLPLTPTAIANLSQQSSNVTINQQQPHQNMAQPAMATVKNGKADRDFQRCTNRIVFETRNKNDFLCNDETNSLPYAHKIASRAQQCSFSFRWGILVCTRESEKEQLSRS